MVTVVIIYIAILVVLGAFTSLVMLAEEAELLDYQIDIVEMSIKGELNSVETVIRNNTPDVEESINTQRPEYMYELTHDIVRLNPSICGSAIAFKPNFFPSKGKYYSPYTYRDSVGNMHDKQLGNDNYDYFQMEWYKKAKETGKPSWSEPYFDEGGGNMAMITCSYPVKDKNDSVFAIITADMMLEQLTVVDTRHIRENYKNAYCYIISSKGTVISHPNKDYILNCNMLELAKKTEDDRDDKMIQEMLEGKDRWRFIHEEDGYKMICFAPLHDVNGWSMAIVCPLEEVLAPAIVTAMLIVVIMFIGLILLFAFTNGTIKAIARPMEKFAQSADEVAKGNYNAKLPIITSKDEMLRLHDSFKAMQQSLVEHIEELKTVNESKGRIESELQIARSIQMGMLPKIYPPYPDRDDIDIFGELTPAKEVGGDLYDFFLRDEKLYFCIGDVSGKGVPAALVMAVTRTLFRNIAAHTSAPDRIVYALNNSIADNNDSNMFVTLFVGVLDMPTGRLRYCNAGHDTPLLIGNTDIGMLPCEPNLPVGIEADWNYVPQETILFPHTTIFLYTDGLTEAENSRLEQFQDGRIIEVAQQSDHAPMPLLKNMKAAVQEFVAGAEANDDLTMLAIQYMHEQNKNVVLQKDISLPNDINTIPQLTAFVEEVCEAVGYDMSTTMSLNLALEEAVVNVMNYAYPAGTIGEIIIEAQCNDRRLKFTITDWGTPFDPTARQDVDTTLSVEDRPIGGLGIHLVRQIMDSINYERLDGKNVLTLRKKVPEKGI